MTARSDASKQSCWRALLQQLLVNTDRPQLPSLDLTLALDALTSCYQGNSSVTVNLRMKCSESYFGRKRNDVPSDSEF